MKARVPQTVALTCHPLRYSGAVHGIKVRVCWMDGRALTLTYALKGDLTRLRIPSPRPPARADRLWEHTCFEAFVSVNGKTEYYEFDFAPSGKWAAYAFRRYRDGVSIVKEELAPKITVRSSRDGLELDAIIRLGGLATIQPRAALRLAFSAVVEDKNGGLSYWALKHPPGKPDFHHPDAFALELEPAHGRVLNESATGKR